MILDGITFTSCDLNFDGPYEITDVDITVTFTKTSGSCHSPDSEYSSHREFSLILQRGDKTVALVRPYSYSGGDDIDEITVTFDDSAAARVSGTQPVTGTFTPFGRNGWRLNSLVGNDPLVD